LTSEDYLEHLQDGDDPKLRVIRAHLARVFDKPSVGFGRPEDPGAFDLLQARRLSGPARGSDADTGAAVIREYLTSSLTRLGGYPRPGGDRAAAGPPVFDAAPDVWLLTGSVVSATGTTTHAAANAAANHRWVIANSPALLLVARLATKNIATVSHSAVGCKRGSAPTAARRQRASQVNARDELTAPAGRTHTAQSVSLAQPPGG
jgi:hypothetical protein